MTDEPTDAEFYFRCKCSRAWREVWPVPIRADAMAKRLGHLTCPSCNGKDLSFVLGPEEE